MNKLIYILSFMLMVIGVSCEKENWFSPEEVDEIRSEYQTQINALTISKNELETQATSLTTQIEDLNATVTTLGLANDDQLAEIATLTTSIGNLNTQVTTLDAEILTLTTSIGNLNTQVTTLDAEILTLTTSNTTLTTSNTDLTTQFNTLNASVSTLNSSITTLQASVTALEVDILILQDWKSVTDKLDVMVAATISDANLNTAVDSVSLGMASTSLTPSTLKGLITAESGWIFNNAIKSGTVSMTTSATTFYDNSTDTNVINFRTLVTEMTAAWNAAKETTFILWWIEFIKEYENL